MSLPAATFAAPMSYESSDRLQDNIASIKDCLKENKADKEKCTGITKAFCHLDQPICNRQEADAWDTLAIRKRPALKKSQAAFKRSVTNRCKYSGKASGYAGIQQPEPWEPDLAPSGCELQQSVHRYLRMSRNAL
ncbi:MAG: hypothetical protein ACOYNL_08615 [Rickettsiales bacterium]